MTKNCQILLTLTAAICSVLSGRASAADPPLTMIYSFPSGFSPDAAVVIGTNGSFYGVTATGGPGNDGGIYEVTSSGVLTNMIWLGGTNGATPQAPLIQDKSGNFYGTASRGGTSTNGTIFKMTPAGQIQWRVLFDNTNGSGPLAPLLEGTNGYFYGTTFNGGSNNAGSIFRVSSGGALTSMYSFKGSNGANPVAGLIQGTDGNLYGTTAYGGADGLGTVFKLTFAGALTTLCSFSNNTGAFPNGLAEDTSGNFYGPTISGGNSLFPGTIFKLSSSDKEQTLFTFGITNGADPNSSLILASDGYWYGTSEEGGSNNLGTIFRFNTKGTLTNLASFDGANGSLPRAGLILGSNGSFYGTTSAGGTYGYGEIYQWAASPYIIKPPASQKYAGGGAASFSVEAGGSAPLSYQWMFDGTNSIAGATNPSLVVYDEQLTNGGTYTVLVSNPYNTVSADAVLSVVAPTVTIHSPPATVSNSSLTVAGTAAGPNGVAIVRCQLNTNGPSAAAGTAHWQTNLTLQPGTNTLQAQSFDPAGNASAIKSATVFYVTYSPLTLQTSGLGSISTKFTGTNLMVGRGYTMKATPAAGMIFSNWTGSLVTNSNPLTFVMISNMMETANFVTNPFIASAGTYEGLFFTSNAVAEQSAGLLSSLVIKTTGAYSGQIVLKGLHYGFTGSFGASEQSSPTIARSAAQGGSLTMEMTLSNNEVTGNISGTDSGGWQSTLRAERTTAPSGSAEFTMLIPPGLDAPSNSPPGYGYALATNHNGSVTLSGAVADGAAFSQTVSIVGGGDVPFYASLYGNAGLLLGWLNLSGGLTASNLWWIKTSSSSSALYTNGFTNLVTNVLTSAWTKPAASYLPFGVLTITNSGPALEIVVSISDGTLLAEPGSTANSLTGSLNAKTGLLKIIFGNGTGSGTTTGYAAILGDSTNGGGYYVTKTNAGTITLIP
jgi:uncharacterized repeat protein (TIGR03803 family)